MPKNVSDLHEIVLGTQKIVYEVRVSPRARYLRMTMNMVGGLTVTVPRFGGRHLVEDFLREKAAWILLHHNRIKKLKEKTVLPQSNEAYTRNKNSFLKRIKERLEFFNGLYRFSYRNVRIGNQRSLWGSCSRSGNLQFNFKLSYLPQEAIDYVVVHELCHLQEHNHGPKFWALVSKTIPQHRKIRKTLRGYILNSEVL